MDSSRFVLISLLSLLFSNSAETLFEHSGNISLSPNNCKGNVSIPDDFKISFDLEIGSWSSPTGWIHIFDIDGDNSGAINLRYSHNNGKHYLYYIFTSDDAIAKYFIDTFPIDTTNDGQSFHIETKVSQTHIVVTIDGDVVLGTAKTSHTLLMNKEICFAFSNGEYDDISIVSGEISNFVVSSIEYISLFDASEEGVRNQVVTLECAEGEPCTIICDEYRSCLKAVINCPTDAVCNVSCTAAQACPWATFNWPLIAGLGHLTCSGYAACLGTSFPIPDPNTDYSLSCDDMECYRTTINCPTDAKCDISCLVIDNEDNFKSACSSATIKWPDIAGYGNLSCSGENSCFSVTFPIPDPNTEYSLSCGWHECTRTTINCPTHAACDIKCDGEVSCDRATINCPRDAACSVTCSDNYACRDVSVNWPDIAGYGTLSCSEDIGVCDDVNEPPTGEQRVYVLEYAMWIIGASIVFLSVYIYHLIRCCGGGRKQSKYKHEPVQIKW